MRTPEDILEQPEFEVEILHEATADHAMAIVVSRDGANGDVQYMYGAGLWADGLDGKPLPLCHIPCEVWNRIVDQAEAGAIMALAAQLAQAATIMSPTGPLEVKDQA